MIPALCLMLLQFAAVDTTMPRHATDVMAAVTAVRVEPAARPSLDGRLDEPAWARAAPITRLIQRDPDEGTPSSEAVDVRFLYDADALFVAARLYDSEPRRIVSRLARRDASTHSDEFRLFLDSHHDHRTAFEFIVNPAGVKSDVLIGGDGAYDDNSWDPVWEAATSVDSLGWTVELQIPFSQLRFSRAPTQVWGVQVERWIERKHELAMFPFVAKTEEGVASRFAHLAGLSAVPAPRRLEFLPYAFARGSFEQPERANDPFNDGSSYFGGAGADLKYGLSSSLTLDATFNPDFGQVEVDPAYVNLTEFEQELQERRPFFIEGGDLFTFGGNGGGLVKFADPPQFFYSRRIGAPPHGSPTSPGQFEHVPETTTIVSAAKLTGRRASGWSVGLLDALTAREWATVLDTTTGRRYRDEVEPLTNYFAGRLKRELRGGNTTLGIIGSAVHRESLVPALDELRTAAYDGGVDLFHRWGHNTYSIAASIGGSYILGDSTAIQRAQRNSNRYYQRPDAQRVSYDPARTTLSGTVGDLYVNKIGGRWSWSVAAGFASPGFEVNDFGFQNRVDRRSVGAGLRRRWTRPGRVFRQSLTTLSYAQAWNYDGDLIQRKVGAYTYGQFRNFWSGDVSATYNAWTLDDRLTRGGPLAAKPAGWSASGELSTDSRKPLVGYVYGSYARSDAGSWSASVLPQLTLRPSAALSLSVGPYYFGGHEAAQFLRRVGDPVATATLGARYVFAELEQHTLDITVRVNATFSPVLSIQLYAQPFTFAGDYHAFKELRARGTFAFNAYGRDNGSTIGDTVLVSGRDSVPGYVVDPGGGGQRFTFTDPDFRTRSLQINAVLRWEYRPGSTLYVAWTQSRSGFFPFDGSFHVGRDLWWELLRDRPANVLLVKVNYWLSR